MQRVEQARAWSDTMKVNPARLGKKKGVLYDQTSVFHLLHTVRCDHINSGLSCTSRQIIKWKPYVVRRVEKHDETLENW